MAEHPRWLNEVPEPTGCTGTYAGRPRSCPPGPLLRARDDAIGWDVPADPEGHEFCVFPPRERRSG